MTARPTILLVTGGIGGGKTALLARLRRATRRWWRSCGFLSLAEPRDRRPGTPAGTYRLAVIGRPGTLPWATRRPGGRGFDFNEDTRVRAGEAVRARLDRGDAELCIVDEIGRLELAGRGFADLFRRALDSRCRVVVAAVRKDVLEDVRAAFGIPDAGVVDLDEVPPDRALRGLRRRIAGLDAERPSGRG